MDQLWGVEKAAKDGASAREQECHASQSRHLFTNGKFAMFIHWGLYSMLGNEYKNETYFGISEWIMSPHLADIPVSEYRQLAEDFYPSQFNATAIAQLAKNAGMKYIVMTAKHHEGFAMYDSEASDFTIVKATEWKRDPLAEMAQAARSVDLGFGIYYSHNQDWIYPGGTGYNGPPEINPNTKEEYRFDDYFYEKCLPQVEELSTNYGPLDVIWFDTPGKMPQIFVEHLIETVRRYQPGALISGRVGYGLGDYVTLGDMEVPLRTPDHELWESVDTTNDSWGYAAYDRNFKSPQQILQRLLSSVARGGTYMINIGPKGDGSVPLPAQKALEKVGSWLKIYGDLVVYGTNPSPWNHGFPWGDAAQDAKSIFLFLYHWPISGELYLPVINGIITNVSLLVPASESKQGLTKEMVGWAQEETHTLITIGAPPPNDIVSVVQLELEEEHLSKTDQMWHIDPNMETSISMDFADSSHGAQKLTKRWMEKFGEWKSVVQVKEFVNSKARAVISVKIVRSGYYSISLTYASDKKTSIEWVVRQNNGNEITNSKPCSPQFTKHAIGWMYFDASTCPVTLTVSSPGPPFDKMLALTCIHFVRIDL